jgi:hypothetical protein
MNAMNEWVGGSKHKEVDAQMGGPGCYINDMSCGGFDEECERSWGENINLRLATGPENGDVNVVL